MSNYNPFNKPISKLEAKDLGVLKDIPEGWYIEYKGSLLPHFLKKARR